MKINIEIDTEKDQDLETVKEIIEYLKSLLKWLKSYGDYGQSPLEKK